MELTLSAAAQATGRGKSTLLRAVKSGKISARRTEDGTFLVEASELHRVFPVKHLDRTIEAPVTRHDAPWSAGEPPLGAGGAEVGILQVKVAMLEAQLERERETVEDLRKRLDQEQEERRILQRQLMAPSPERTQGQPKAGGLLRRLLGR